MGSSSSSPSSGRSRGRSRSADRSTYYNRHNGLSNRNNGGIDSEITGRTRPYSEAPEEVLKVSKVDLDIRKNTKEHHTYELTEIVRRQELPIRRGQEFSIKVDFNRAYDPSDDDLRIVLQYGQTPRPKSGTHVEIILSDKDVKNEWGAFIKSNQGNTLYVGVMSTAKCPVGKWSLKIDVVKRTDRDATVYRYTHASPIYILFNPWCKNDDVYMKEEKPLEEYVMSEKGQIYAGNSENISPKPWNFGQFDEVSFDCAMYLLEMLQLQNYLKGNPVLVARGLSGLVNAPDDDGVLVGNWSGDYAGGTSPLAWNGSVGILKEYWTTKRPVQFGQCWVFSGVLTTVCRAVGIPARSVTNFSSAHDTDGSITIDKHFDPNGEPMNDLNNDSVWNFHVWNDAWMARPDLPQGYGGWQAIDATPQETSEGLFQMGPVSLLAIKRGEVHLPFDGRFCFGEVNADQIFWAVRDGGSKEVTNIKPKSVGKYISTKKPFRNEREDVTDQYKFKEDTDEELAAVLRAQEHAFDKKAREVYKAGTKDVAFKIVANKSSTFMGDCVEFGLEVQNNSEKTRTIRGVLSFSSYYYTGVVHKPIKKDDFKTIVVEPKKKSVIDMKVDEKEYLDKLTDHCICMISTLCHVDETYQTFGDIEEFRIRKPHLDIVVSDTGKVGEKMNVEVSFVNPLSVTLTDCELRVEGISKPTKYKEQNVGSKQTYKREFEILPDKPGDKQISVYFNSTQLLSVNVSRDVVINE